MQDKSRFWTSDKPARQVISGALLDRALQTDRLKGHLMKQESAQVRVIASTKNWIEGAAVQQLEKTAALPGMRLAMGLPDLHPGKGSPIGA